MSTNKNITYLGNEGVDPQKAILLAEASIQAYDAFDMKTPTRYSGNVVPPNGYEFVECWTGVDAVFNKDKAVEIYGVVFRTKVSPYTYIFAFRGTDSTEDLIDDFGADHVKFVPYKLPAGQKISENIEVESGFYRIYTDTTDTTASMQQQVFALVDKYNSSDGYEIDQLFVTGHSLGATLATLFTFDMALCDSKVSVTSYNYASPRVGNKDFVSAFMSQTPQQNEKTRTVRFQNAYDKVPCVPLECMGYEHLPYAYLISFYLDKISGKFNIVDDHSIQNYKTVLSQAFNSSDGFYEGIFEYDGNKIKSVKPEVKDVCKYLI